MHNHESLYNYADVAKLLRDLGVPDTVVVGGFLWYPEEHANWEQFLTPMSGKTFPNFQWSPSILWGGATMNHQGPESEASGVWHPKSVANFHEDDSNNPLSVIGTYRDAKFEIGQGEGLTELIEQVRAGAHPEGVMLTAAIFTGQCTLSALEIQKLADFISAHQSDVNDGILVWATLPDIVEIWKNEYGGNAYIYNSPSFEE